MNIVEVQHVTKKFSNHIALKDLSLTIPKGSIFGLLGPNGAGKTTLIRMLNQITVPDSGVILYQGRPLQREDIETVGYLPEERGLYKKMKISDQVIYLARLKGLPMDVATKRLQFWFKKFGIESWWNRKVTDLSKGMQQKIQFIVTIVHQPNLLIFDEPFSGFDPINAELLKNEIIELRNNGATIVLSTHNMNSVEEICDQIVLLNNGEKVLEGNLNEIKKQFRTHCYEIKVANALDVPFPDTFHVLSQYSENQDVIYKIKMDPSENPNQLLAWFVSKTSIIDYHEVIPSMNDIFIETITAQNVNRK